MSLDLKGLGGFFFHEFCPIFLRLYKPFTSMGSHGKEFHYFIKHLIKQRRSFTQEWCFGQILQCRKGFGGCLRELVMLNDPLSLANQEKKGHCDFQGLESSGKQNRSSSW